MIEQASPSERLLGLYVTTFAAADLDKQTSPELRECVITAQRILSLTIERTALAGLRKRRAQLKKVEAELLRDGERFVKLLTLNPQLKDTLQ